MALNNCAECGGAVWLRAMKVRINRRQGVHHWIEHKDSSDPHETGWSCTMLKPYPKRDADKPWSKLIERWNEANP